MKPQCDHRSPVHGRRLRGLRCRRRALWYLWPRNGEGSINYCTIHRDEITRRAHLNCRAIA